MIPTATPRLSVIVPVYNAEAYLRQCLASVLTQDLQDLEVICVDDGSTDGSLALLWELAAAEPRLRVIPQENRSAGAARNHGLTYARGEYVHFLDADDWIASGLYSHVLGLLEEKQADVCVFQYNSYDNTAGQTKRHACVLDYEGKVLTFRDRPAFFLYNVVTPWNKVYRRAWLEEHALRFDEIVCGNDRGFYYRMLAAGGRMVLTSFCGVFYRVQNAGSLTGSGRYRHFDSLFTAWDTSAEAMANQPEAVRAMLLDCVVRDLLAVLRAAPREGQQAAAQQLGRRFAETDFSVIRALPFPCTWMEEAELLRRDTLPCRFPETRTPMFVRLRIFLGIWGVRGLAVKLFSR